VGDTRQRQFGRYGDRSIEEAANGELWPVLGEELPAIPSGRPRDPYLEQGCHPDVVGRIWDDLASHLPRDCRAQAKGRPVLAHPDSDRIFAFARGTSYALWLVPEDFEQARAAGAATSWTWAGGRVTDLAASAGQGWIWGRWYANEPSWMQRSYAAAT
jgi:hypothetical protein